MSERGKRVAKDIARAVEEFRDARKWSTGRQDGGHYSFAIRSQPADRRSAPPAGPKK